MKLSQGRDIQKELAGNIVLVLESKLLNLSALSAIHLAVGGWLCYSRLWKLSRNWSGRFAMTFSSATVVICQQFQVGVPLVVIGSSHLHTWICASFREPTMCNKLHPLPRSCLVDQCPSQACAVELKRPGWQDGYWWPRHPKGWLGGCCIFAPYESLT